jgi:hypothetical protein
MPKLPQIVLALQGTRTTNDSSGRSKYQNCTPLVVSAIQPSFWVQVERDLNVGGQSAAVSNSGPTVDNSVPGVTQPTSLARAGRTPDARRPHSAVGGDHDKSCWGFGGEAPNKEKSGEAAPHSSFLDEIQINRNKIPGRGKHCGKLTVRGHNPLTRTTHFHRVNCKCWHCGFCGPRKAKRYKRAITRTAEALHLCRFATLTLDPSKIEGDPVRYLNRVWAKLRIYLKRKYGVAPAYIRVLEFQRNGNPHLHILIDRFIAQTWLQQAWQAVGGGRFVNIKFVDIQRVGRYISKYLTKELLLSAPLRSRRVTTSRGIHLLEKQPTEMKWELLRLPILRLFDILREFVTEYACDEDAALLSFVIAETPRKNYPTLRWASGWKVC